VNFTATTDPAGDLIIPKVVELSMTGEGVCSDYQKSEKEKSLLVQTPAINTFQAKSEKASIR
jgi:hypothetical protein